MLKAPPTAKHLSRMYYELAQEGASCSGEKYPWPYRLQSREEKLILAADMTRWDPRLLGIFVEFLLKNWRHVQPQILRQYYSQMKTPQTLAVVAEFCRAATSEKEIQYYCEYLQKGLRKVSDQFYFKGLYAPGGKLGQAAADKSIKEYKKWGFLAREAPTIDVYSKKTVGRLDTVGRINVLTELFKVQSELSLGDYLHALKYGISRQQALADLKKIAQLKKGTRGRGARWKIKKSHL